MSLKEQLIGSIRSGDNQKVSDVLEQMNAEEVNEKDEYGYTTLHKACRWENNRALSLLLAKPGINVNVKGRFGNTPLHEAGGCNNHLAVDQLLGCPGIDMNARDNYGQTPLHVAGLRNNHLAVDQLLGCPGIDMNARDNHGHTPIMKAARRCSKEALGAMLEAPRVDLDVKDNGGRGRGLEESVGLWGRSTANDKKKCVDMIQGERMKRKNVLKNEKQKSGEESTVGIGIEKIERISKKIEDGEKRWKENVDSRKLKRRELDQKQSLEMERLAMRHKNEKSSLEETFDREEQDNERYVASLKEIRKDLAKDIEKMTIDPSNDDGGKLEAAQETLECPVCMESMKPPTRIWMCRSSHAICEACKDQLIRVKGGPHPLCPTCNSERVNQRAIMAEKFAEFVFNK